MVRARKVRRYTGNIMLGLGALLCCLIQTSVLPYFKIFGAIPCLTLAYLVSASPYANKPMISCYAVSAGFILGSLGGESFVYYPISFLLAVCLGMIVAETLSALPFLSCMLSAAVAFVCDGLMACAVTMYEFPTASIGSVLSHTVLPQIGASLLVFVPVYFIMLLHKRIFYKV